MKRTITTIAVVALLFGCSTVKTPLSIKAVGCNYWCYPTFTDHFVSLTRTNAADGTSDTWNGGILTVKAGDYVEATYTQDICTNQPRAAITFCSYCSNNTVCFFKNIPATGYTMAWNISTDCTNCVFTVANNEARLCASGGGGQRPGRPRGLWDMENGTVVPVKRKK
jgi:hypothetical protein